MAVPRYFCWTRFGSEAGQPFRDIVLRKEQERAANGGLFLWGIGNSVGDAIVELVKRTRDPQILFSPIKSPARPPDVRPSGVLMWTRAVDIAGEEYTLPPRSLVTSRETSRHKTAHYALVCFSRERLPSSEGTLRIDAAALTNLVSGRRVGSSQVTAVVERHPTTFVTSHLYDVPFRARLVYPYFIYLRNPVPLQPRSSVGGWAESVRALWGARHRETTPDGEGHSRG
jgi:hypothetical protein